MCVRERKRRKRDSFSTEECRLKMWECDLGQTVTTALNYDTL